jgi:chromate transporter
MEMAAGVDWAAVATLFQGFVQLSLLAIGGAVSVAPEMHRVFVEQEGLLSDRQFTGAMALAQAAPGPNVLFVAVMGFHAAGLAGALAAMLGIMLPSTTLALIVSRWGRRRQDWRAVQAFKAGMAPVTLGLIAATGWLLAPAAGQPAAIGLAVACAILVWRTRIHLLWLLAAGAAAGVLGWV